MNAAGQDAWNRAEAAAQDAGRKSIPALFDAESDRLQHLSLDVERIHFDFSKTHFGPDLAEAFRSLADARGLTGWRERLLSGGIVNPTEDRAATHSAARGVGSEGDVEEANEARRQMRALAERIERGAFGEIRHILHIGIGGSALGPALLLDALGGGKARYDAHIISNIDGTALARALGECDPKRTLIIVVSKSFTTLETMTNAESALSWMEAAGVGDPKSRVVAVTAAPGKARDWGTGEDNILGFAESVGGRYSLWTGVGLVAALALGWDRFEALLEGAAAMDRHFADADFERNAPVLAGMIDVLYAALLGAETRAVFAYDERLRLLPAYLQQLEMESNGKRVDRDGRALTHPSAAITWGGTGTDAQHAVFQLLHQGTALIPAEFIAVIEPGHDLGPAHHEQLLANCIAQGAALLKGRTAEEAKAAGADVALAAAKTFPGNRPSTTILLDRLDARALGALLAFYEHRTFTAGVLLGINSFDQMGVELGKDMARAISSGGGSDFDPSSRELMRRAGLAR